MARIFKGLGGGWLWRGAALLALVLASFQSASADNSTATITLFAPGAPAGARAAVQYQVTFGEWFNVSGWENTLTANDNDVLYQQWTVDKANFGQGPFRWVVYQADGKTVWAISDVFSTPPGGGMDQSETIRTDNQVGTASTTAIQTAVGEAVQVPVLKGGSVVWNDPCTGCDPHAHITAYISGLPVNSWLVVQWQDAAGAWHTVQGWQGNASSLYADGELNGWTPTGTGTLFQQWSVVRANYGQGPFHWAVYSAPNGALLAVSPTFTLPTMDGANQIMYLSK